MTSPLQGEGRRFESARTHSRCVEFVLDYVQHGSFGEAPETIHEKAFHLLRLLVANHPFVDGNKRTALDATAVFYTLNGYRFDYDEEIRSVLKRFGTDEAAVDEASVVDYLRDHTRSVGTEDALAEWRDGLVEFGLSRLADDDPDPND